MRRMLRRKGEEERRRRKRKKYRKEGKEDTITRFHAKEQKTGESLTDFLII